MRKCLNNSECEVYYTMNNFLTTNNKGINELKDILDCIDKYNINDTDFIVKMTGIYIYILNDNLLCSVIPVYAYIIVIFIFYFR